MRTNWQRKAVHMLLGGMLIFSAIPSFSAAEEAAVASPQSAEQAKVADLNIIQTKITREEAINIAKNAFAIPEGFEQGMVSLESFPYEHKPVWQMSWHKTSPKHHHIHVSVDANTGMIVSYNSSSDDDQTSISFPPKVSYEQAVSIARKFINNIYGEKATMFQYVESEQYGTVIKNIYDRYRINFSSMVDGVPFPINSITVGVDSNGEVTDLYAAYYDNVQFAPTENVKSPEEIWKLIKEEMDMRLVYQNSSYDTEQKEKTIVLAYQPKNSGYWDAVNGRQLDNQGKPIADHEQAVALFATEKQADVPTPREQLLTEQEATRILQAQYKIPKEITVNSIHKDEKYYRSLGPVWTFQFEYRMGNGSIGWTGAAVDAASGKVLHFDISTYLSEKWRDEHGDEDTDNEKDYKISREQALETARQFVKKHHPEKLHQLSMSDDFAADMKYYYAERSGYPLHRFVFTRIINGIPYPNDRVSVTISGIDGEVVGFEEFWGWNVQFPPADQVIPVEQAKDIYLADKKVQLIYHVFDSDYSSLRKGQKVEARPVYRLNSAIKTPYYLRAADGMLINMETGLPVSADGAEGAADIKGHWAEKELAHLLKLQIIKADEEGNIHPDRHLTRGAFVDMFAKLTDPAYRYRYDANDQPIFTDVGKDHEYYTAIQWAVNQELVERTEGFAPDRAITREEMAKFIVSSMGLDNLANRPGLFNLRFADKEQIAYPGHVAIVDSIGIMKGSENKFRPDDPVTLAEAAKALTIYMNERGKYAPRLR